MAAAGKFDADAFAKDVREVRDKTKPSEAEDAEHMKKMEMWTAVLGVSGLLLAVRGVISPTAMVLFGLYKFAKFAILAHHSLHGGWGRTRRGWFAQNLSRRIVDWLDWIFPQAWIAEHNKEHHYYLNEDADPDFVQRNLEFVQELDAPLASKYMLVLGQASVWKWFYYASNTLKLLHKDAPNAPSKQEFWQPLLMTSLVWEAIKGSPWHRSVALDFFIRVMGPPFVMHFLAVPVLAGLLFRGGSLFCWTTFLNLAGAEIYTNLHAFAMIVTNHAGEDLWWFPNSCKADTAEFYLRAILGSTAYHTGGDVCDYIHGFLNYQGEHHAFPELSPLHYQRMHPFVLDICKTYGVPYVKEPFWVRTKKTADIMVGVAKHKVMKGNAVDNVAQWQITQK